MHHDLKCVEPHFSDVVAGRKPFEIRNNDRNFLHGDTFTLHHYDAELCVSDGRTFGPREITYITNYAQGPNQVVFSWAPSGQKVAGHLTPGLSNTGEHSR